MPSSLDPLVTDKVVDCLTLVQTHIFVSPDDGASTRKFAAEDEVSLKCIFNYSVTGLKLEIKCFVGDRV